MHRAADNIDTVQVGLPTSPGLLNQVLPAGIQLGALPAAILRGSWLRQSKAASPSVLFVLPWKMGALSSLIHQLLSPLVQGQNRIIANNDLDSIFLQL